MKDKIVAWIKDYFGERGKAIIGISGGKDSTVAAALCVEALGKNRVLGVLMPEGIQKDIEDSYRVCKFLDIPHYEVNIGVAMDALTAELPEEFFGKNNNIYYTNTPARLRMTTLYAVAGLVGGRVCNTSNAAEVYVGYSTKWGDGVGDFAPLRDLTVAEVIEVGRQCGLPEDLLVKPPADGMSGKTDEDNLGFTYEDVARVMNTDIEGMDLSVFAQIVERHVISEHKRGVNIPYFKKGSN